MIRTLKTLQDALRDAPANSAVTALTPDRPARATASHARIRVHGKFLTRGAARLLARGVTYGPFAPNQNGEHLPDPRRVCADFELMRAAGINAIRTYHAPPDWFYELADEEGMAVFVDIPWAKHVCFLDSLDAQRASREAVRAAARTGRRHPCVLAYSIGNEIPSDIIRWHRAARVERFLSELADEVRQADPYHLVTYASYPPTEYLDLPFLDFLTFNVYLHDREAFRRYLARLQHLAGDRPVLLGELGMDSLRNGEETQAEFLEGHLREAILDGLAGAFAFAWTDDWYTGGFAVEDWAFGITKRDRDPKPAYHAVERVFGRKPSELLEDSPGVSIVVCSYNGASTLDECLRSLLRLDYQDYEVILVDDGSTDETPQIAARYPSVRTIRQPNQGLSAARNAGLWAATGEIVAYTDSDCYADPHWLTHLVHQLRATGASAVGGPNITPEDGRIAACVAASPGQPTHVLVNDQVAEHIPGCNMAFRREALESINGFSPIYRKAGDDVDLCWRLQQAGMWITFAPGAFVWHHRRQTPRAYLKQQAGYGEAEGLLWFDHPDRFNGFGQGKWQGAMYGASLEGLRFGRPVIYRGTFASGLFQTLYRPGPAHWASLPSTLEWHLAALVVAVAAASWHPLWPIVPAMLLVSLCIAGLRARQAFLPREHHGLRSRLLVAGLSYLQPLVRSWHRYCARLLGPRVIAAPEASEPGRAIHVPVSGALQADYWDERWRDRTELLEQVVERLSGRLYVVRVDSGWERWDLEVYGHPWTRVQIRTAQEDHGSGRRLFRLRFQMRASGYSCVCGVVAALMSGAALSVHGLAATILATGLAAACGAAWLRGAKIASSIASLVDSVAAEMGLIRCVEQAEERRAPSVGPGRPVVEAIDEQAA